MLKCLSYISHLIPNLRLRQLEQVKRFAFSGGQDTLEKHRELGANLEIDVPYNYLRFFLEDDDELAMVRFSLVLNLVKYAWTKILTPTTTALLCPCLPLDRH